MLIYTDSHKFNFIKGIEWQPWKFASAAKRYDGTGREDLHIISVYFLSRGDISTSKSETHVKL